MARPSWRAIWRLLSYWQRDFVPVRTPYMTVYTSLYEDYFMQSWLYSVPKKCTVYLLPDSVVCKGYFHFVGTDPDHEVIADRTRDRTCRPTRLLPVHYFVNSLQYFTICRNQEMSIQNVASNHDVITVPMLGRGRSAWLLHLVLQMQYARQRGISLM